MNETKIKTRLQALANELREIADNQPPAPDEWSRQMFWADLMAAIVLVENSGAWLAPTATVQPGLRRR